jgi:hypothetical protein
MADEAGDCQRSFSSSSVLFAFQPDSPNTRRLIVSASPSGLKLRRRLVCTRVRLMSVHAMKPFSIFHSLDRPASRYINRNSFEQ